MTGLLDCISEEGVDQLVARGQSDTDVIAGGLWRLTYGEQSLWGRRGEAHAQCVGQHKQRVCVCCRSPTGDVAVRESCRDVSAPPHVLQALQHTHTHSACADAGRLLTPVGCWGVHTYDSHRSYGPTASSSQGPLVP